eukprot:300571-Chlamydomonas_euryale.AAC.20
MHILCYKPKRHKRYKPKRHKRSTFKTLGKAPAANQAPLESDGLPDQVGEETSPTITQHIIIQALQETLVTFSLHSGCGVRVGRSSPYSVNKQLLAKQTNPFDNSHRLPPPPCAEQTWSKQLLARASKQKNIMPQHI